MAVIAMEIFPKVLNDGAPLPVLASFLAGGLMMVSVKIIGNNLEDRHIGGTPMGRILTAGFDTGIDGLIVGVGLVAGNELGLLLALALSIDLFILILSIGSDFRETSTSKKTTLAITSGIALMLAVGIVAGVFVFSRLSDPAIAALLAFATTALLYVISEELLVKEHAEGQKPITISYFYLGFLGFMAFTLFH